MTIKTNNGYMPGDAIAETFLQLTGRMNMTAVFMSGVTGEPNEKQFIGIGEKETNGDKTYHLITLNVLGKDTDAMAVAGEVQSIPRTFPEAMTLLTEIIKDNSPQKKAGNSIPHNQDLTRPGEEGRGFTRISQEDEIRFIQSLAFQGYSLLVISRKWTNGNFTNQYVGLAKKLNSQSDSVYLVNIDDEQSTVGTQAMDLPVALFSMADEIIK